MNPSKFVGMLSSIVLEDVFNPYADECAAFDVPGAAAIRRQNLLSLLRAAELIGVDTLWIGRDLVYRGGRRTGVALTDEVHLGELQSLFKGSELARATRGPAVAERTAAEIWRVLRTVEHRPLLWNVFPLHPHEAGNELSNRRFTSKELRSVIDLNLELIRWLKITKIVAIGNDAAEHASRLGVTVSLVRHPSYGGIADFRAGMSKLYPGDCNNSLFFQEADSSVNAEQASCFAKPAKRARVKASVRRKTG